MFDIVYNPVAGKGRSAAAFQIVTRVLSERGILYRVHTTTRFGEAKDLTAEAIAAGATDVIAMGGDGTINEVLNGFTDFTRCNLGIIPCGTGNDFAAAVGISEDPEEALRHILEGTPVYTDYFETPFCRGINLIGAGIDVEVLRRYNRKTKHTKGAYFSSLLSAILHHKPYRFTTEVNGEKQTHDCFIVAVGNGRQIGGGLTMCPKADPADGLLDVVIVENIKKIAIPGALMKLLKGKILEFKKTKFVRAESISVSADTPITVQVDGEIYENVNFSVRVVHNTLRMYRLTGAAGGAKETERAVVFPALPEKEKEAAATEDKAK